MKVRYFEGFARHVLAAQPWVKSVRTFAQAGVDKPVGLVIEPAAGPTVAVQVVRASPSTPISGEQSDEWTGVDATAAPPVQAAPRSPQEWAAAIVAAVQAAAHPEVRVVETFEDWGRTTTPAGIRVEFTTGAEVFGTILDGQRR